MLKPLTDAHRHSTTRTQGRTTGGNETCDRRNRATTFHSSSLWRQGPGQIRDVVTRGAISLRDRGCPVATGPPSRALHLNEAKAVIQRENGSRHLDIDRLEASNLAGGEKRQVRKRARNWPSSRLPMRASAPKDVSTEDTSATDIR
ncbi:hypothetical protein QBC45DRAFT_462304 [Copromyces sp. CBS 386.78]|nr:hypothetical protein QBC45DRAFT_462304 [Copromyces sp. CBS 386.78]